MKHTPRVQQSLYVFLLILGFHAHLKGKLSFFLYDVPYILITGNSLFLLSLCLRVSVLCLVLQEFTYAFVIVS